MKSVQICFIFVLIPIAKGHFNVVQCYVCDDCDVFDDCLLQSCPQITTTTSSSTITTQTTRAPMSTTTPTPLTGTTPSTSQPTIIITTTTAEKPGISASDATIEEATSTEMSSSTTSSTTEQTIYESTLVPEQSTQIMSNHSYKPFLMHYPVRYYCYSIDIVENYKNKKRRGCVMVPVHMHGCTVLKSEFGCSAKNCKLCSLDRCNSCRALKYSILALIICIVTELIFK